MAGSDTVTTRFLVISDTHSITFDEVSKHKGKCLPPFPRADVVLHCGDWTNVGSIGELKHFIRFMHSFDAELKLVIAGNHDLTMDRNYCENTRMTHRHLSIEEHEKALNLLTGPEAKEAGITYLDEGLHSFTLSNGAKFTIYTSQYTPAFCGWGFPYRRNEDRFNTSEQVDEVSTSIAVKPMPNHGSVDSEFSLSSNVPDLRFF